MKAIRIKVANISLKSITHQYKKIVFFGKFVSYRVIWSRLLNTIIINLRRMYKRKRNVMGHEKNQSYYKIHKSPKNNIKQ